MSEALARKINGSTDATLFALALSGVAVSFYTHLRLGEYVRGEWQRLFLALLGIGVGIVASTSGIAF